MTVTNIISFYMKTARGVEGEGFANLSMWSYIVSFFPAIRSIMENPNYNKRDNIIYREFTSNEKLAT